MQETVFVRDMMGQERVKDDVRELWFDVCNETVTDHVPRGLQELQAATVKAGKDPLYACARTLCQYIHVQFMHAHTLAMPTHLSIPGVSSVQDLWGWVPP